MLAAYRVLAPTLVEGRRMKEVAELVREKIDRQKKDATPAPIMADSFITDCCYAPELIIRKEGTKK